MGLRTLQLAMQDALLDESEPSARGIEHAIVDGPPLTPAARLEIYRRAYRSRLIEALEDTYTNLKRAVGDEDFAELGTRFVNSHPSVHRSIRWYGRELAEFLEREAPYREHPLLAELAAFEWALSEAFDAADAVPLERAALTALDPGAWGEMRFRFHPSLRRITLGWNTVAMWRALSEDEAAPDPEPLAHRTAWLLWRRGLKNYFRSLEPLEERALDAAQAGASFAEVCEALSPDLAEEEIPMRAASLVATWMEGGMIISISRD